MEEITVTGSLIKRSDLDSALPIQVIDADKMARVGIITAQDLVRKVPAMQNFTTPADSVGGGGGGLSTANLRGIGDQYTLSLLNGRRMAPATAGSTIDLNNIPLAAVEQVDILTDGASALYGSDAIAGVVNFIMKDSVDETTISFRKDIPEESGGESWVFDLVTGFGDLVEDGYSLVFSYSHEEQDALAAADREFAETGFITFNSGGQQLYFENSSANSIPGNAYVYTAGYDSLVAAFNPNRMANGNCAAQTTPSGDLCRFDYTSTLEILPEHEKDIFFLNGKMDFNENITGFATVLYGTTETINRIAPYPTGLVPLPLDSDLVADYVLPYLTDDEIAQMGEVGGTWRALPGSNRTTKYEIETSNITFGIDGSAGEINYSLAATISETTIDQDYPTGWLLLEEFGELAGSGAINIFASQDEFGPEDAEILSGAIYSGDWDDTETSQTVLEANAGMPLFEMAGGEAQLAVGFDWRRNIYERTVSEANANELLLFLSKDTPYELERDQWGVFSEMLFPVADGLEFTASLRYNDVGATSDELNGSGDIDEGDSDLSYKLSAFWTAIDQLAFRASFGTGFKAPSMREIGEPLSDFGVTSGTYACPFGAGDARAATCNPGSNQYAVFREGSGGLTFETSEQYSFGLVFTPYDQLEVTVDYWSVEIEDQVDRLTEQEIFDNPDVYSDLFTTRTNLSTGRDELAIIQAAVNVATQENTGIDWRIAHGFDLGWGQLDLGLNGTYMIKSESSLYGSSLGRFGSDDQVVFRNIANFDVTLYHGDFTHTLFLNYRSGYDDQAQTVTTVVPGEELGSGDEVGVQLTVGSYTLVDYQFKWTTLEDSLDLTFGIKNLFDEEPPLSLRTSGAGHQVGWDPRYTDAFGRTMYLRAAYSF
ncbi:TonB-dependent receptor [Halioxenophilus aromaticivorans]|uniref:TonB-dependent receptor n=2 Tax=Halioxenophilus aromaticivorans TaxID=1306992 RepID=A0AAV3U150_9ALTE